MRDARKNIIEKLQQDILQWQGHKPLVEGQHPFGLGSLETSFPNGVFPVGIHEFICSSVSNMAATDGFIGGLLSILMQSGGSCLWISCKRQLFPESLATFGVAPDRVLFVDVRREQEVLWVMEEGLKCAGFAAVIAEIAEISLTASRRLQLAVEQKGITGFLLRTDPRKLASNVCSARWQITSIASHLPSGMPGLGHPRWQVELLKVRNGVPGQWEVEWRANQFHLPTPEVAETVAKKKAG